MAALGRVTVYCISSRKYIHQSNNIDLFHILAEIWGVKLREDDSNNIMIYLSTLASQIK